MTVSPLCRKAIAALPQYNAGLSVEAVRSRFAVERIAKLGSNENPHGASPAVLAALVEAGGKTAHYPDGNCVALRGALSRMLGVAPERIIVGNGSENLLELACLAVLEPDGRERTSLRFDGPTFPTNLCFAGPAGDVLVVTAAKGGRVLALDLPTPPTRTPATRTPATPGPADRPATDHA